MTAPRMARRIVAPTFGGPEVLTLVEEELPQAGPGQVTIEVRAAGVNPADHKGFAGLRSRDESRLPGARVIGTAGEHSFDMVRRFGAEPVAYGAGLEDRVREAAPDGIDAALDCIGTDEAVEVSLALAPSKDRIVTIAAQGRARQD